MLSWPARHSKRHFSGFIISLLGDATRRPLKWIVKPPLSSAQDNQQQRGFMSGYHAVAYQ